MEDRHTVTAQISGSESKFLEAMVKQKEYISKSEIVREGIRAIMQRKGYKTEVKA